MTTNIPFLGKTSRSTLIISSLIFSAQASATADSEAIRALQEQVRQMQAQVNILAKQTTTTQANNQDFIERNTIFRSLFSGGSASPQKEQKLLNALKNESVQSGHIYLGAKAETKIFYDTNEKSSGGNSASDFKSQAWFGVLARMNDWFTFYAGFTAKTPSDDLMLKESYMLFANPNKTPFYGIAGYKTVNFGYHPRYDFSISQLTRVFDYGTASQIEGGYYGNGFFANITAFNGDNDAATNANNITNFTGMLNYAFKKDNVSFNTGASIIRAIDSTAKFANGYSIQLADTSTPTPAVSTFAQAKIKLNSTQTLEIFGEYVQTTEQYLNQYTRSWGAQSAFKFIAFKQNLKFAVSYSGLHVANNNANQYTASISRGSKIIEVGLSYGYLNTQQFDDNMLVTKITGYF